MGENKTTRIQFTIPEELEVLLRDEIDNSGLQQSEWFIMLAYKIILQNNSYNATVIKCYNGNCKKKDVHTNICLSGNIGVNKSGCMDFIPDMDMFKKSLREKLNELRGNRDG